MEETIKYPCCFCGEEIPYEQIPKEGFTKISAQVIYHNACLPEEKEESL